MSFFIISIFLTSVHADCDRKALNAIKFVKNRVLEKIAIKKRQNMDNNKVSKTPFTDPKLLNFYQTLEKNIFLEKRYKIQIMRN